MRTVTFGGLDVHVTGGSDGNGGGDGPLVVLLHGFGAPGTDLVGLARMMDVPRAVRFAFPEAPVDLGPMYMGGRAWWWIDLAARERALLRGEELRLEDEVPQGLDLARAQVEGTVDLLGSALGVPPERTILGGFSQGAMLSCDTVLRSERPFAGLALLSGTLLAAQEWTPRMAAKKGLPVFQSHGDADPILPRRGAEHLRDALTKEGLAVEWVAFRGGHEIPGAVLAGLSAFVRRVLA